MRDPARLARYVAAARIATGVALIAAPRRLGGLLIGAEADTPRLFIAAFGARDALLAAGTLRALQAGRPARWWMASCGAADAFPNARATPTSPGPGRPAQQR